jgi:hypothetical protein
MIMKFSSQIWIWTHFPIRRGRVYDALSKSSIIFLPLDRKVHLRGPCRRPKHPIAPSGGLSFYAKGRQVGEGVAL